MEDQINIMQTREMLEIVNIVVPILNKKEHAQLMLFFFFFLNRYRKEEYPNGLRMEDEE